MLSLLTKVWYDLWSNRARTIQVVLVIALGAFGIGLVIGGRNLIAGTIADQWKLAEPPHIKLGVTPPLTDDQLRRIERIDAFIRPKVCWAARLSTACLGKVNGKAHCLNPAKILRIKKWNLSG
jgi:hypothetical protein